MKLCAWNEEVSVFPDGEVVWCAEDRMVPLGKINERAVGLNGVRRGHRLQSRIVTFGFEACGGEV